MKNTVNFFLKWIFIFIAASILIFTIVRLMPVSPAVYWLESQHVPATPENIAFAEQKMGLDRPLTVQYFSWIWNFIRGDWGTTMVSGVDIKEQFMRKLPISITIGMGSILLASVTAFFLGYLASLKTGGFFDRLSSFLTIFAQTVPVFLLSVLIINLFSVKLHLVKFFTGNGLFSIITAILLLALYNVGNFSRVVKESFRKEMSESYIRFTVSRGFEKKRVLLKHAYRPVLVSLISTVISKLASVFGGNSVIEFAFGIPGISFFLIERMKERDYNVIQTYILVLIIWMFLVHLVLRFVLRLLDVNRKGEKQA